MASRKANHLTYDTLNDELVKVLPELHADYERELRWWGDDKPGPHVVFGDILVPRLIDALQTEEIQFLRRAFAFLDEMAGTSIAKIQEVVSMTVLERLIDKPTWLTVARKYMGANTALLADELEIYWKARKRTN
jgi:hypothetical protein